MGTGRHPRNPRLFVFARHGESSANVERTVSGDPARPVALTARGRAQARQLGAQLANLDIDLAVCSRFLRTQQTLEVALRGRSARALIDQGFDDIRAGDLEGEPIEAYWSWEQCHTPSERFPRGESVDDALVRYAGALRRLLSRKESVTVVVLHEFALRHITAAATASASRFPRPLANARPYLFDEPAIERAAVGISGSARFDLAEHIQEPRRASQPRPEGLFRVR